MTTSFFVSFRYINLYSGGRCIVTGHMQIISTSSDISQKQRFDHLADFTTRVHQVCACILTVIGHIWQPLFRHIPVDGTAEGIGGRDFATGHIQSAIMLGTNEESTNLVKYLVVGHPNGRNWSRQTSKGVGERNGEGDRQERLKEFTLNMAILTLEEMPCGGLLLLGTYTVASCPVSTSADATWPKYRMCDPMFIGNSATCKE